VAPADARFLRACRSLPTDRVPVWFMRQAGRSLPEYRARRGAANVLQAVKNPELAAELTLQPVRRLGVDAAILYSDIMVPLAGLGIEVDLVPGQGPVVEPPFRGPSDLARLRPLEPDADVPFVPETVRILAAELEVPLIGFAGGPFTVASYLVEGGASRTWARTKTLMRADPSSWRRLLDALADVSLAFLSAQVEAGARAVQVFDSWVGALSADDYLRHVLPSTRRIFEGLERYGVPRIHFATNAQGELLSLLAAAGADVVGVDWRVTIAEARRLAGPGRAVQGNLDPTACLAPWEVVADEVRRVLAQAEGKPGHVFNLGHGVLPETDPAVLRRIVDLVHKETEGSGALPAKM
jgi:uroporphyrinogen decarboxylase